MKQALPLFYIAAFVVAFGLGLAFFLFASQVPVATDAGTPGHWRVVREPDWGWALRAAAVAAVVVVAVSVLVRGRRALRIGALAVAAGGLLLVPSVFSAWPMASIGCDGSVPRWMLPADYDGSGCIEWPRNWEASQPWDDEELVCLGL